MTAVVPRNTPRNATSLRPDARIEVTQDGIREYIDFSELKADVFDKNGTESTKIGNVAVSSGAGTSSAVAEATITFLADSFLSAPAVTVTPIGSGGTEKLYATLYSVTATSFDVRIHNEAGTLVAADFSWIAIGAAAF